MVSYSLHGCLLLMGYVPLPTSVHPVCGPVSTISLRCGRAAAQRTKFTNETLCWAVQLWCSDRAAALAQHGPIGEWDTSGVTYMSTLFAWKEGFNDDISGWDVSKVKDMRWMFQNARFFNQPLDKSDVSSVKNMYGMFSCAASFNQPLDKWVVSSVEDMSFMFSRAASFNQPLDKWDVSSVKKMSWMFDGAASFNQPLDKWDVSSVTIMSVADLDNGTNSAAQLLPCIHSYHQACISPWLRCQVVPPAVRYVLPLPLNLRRARPLDRIPAHYAGQEQFGCG
jgi:surface protein